MVTKAGIGQGIGYPGARSAAHRTRCHQARSRLAVRHTLMLKISTITIRIKPIGIIKCPNKKSLSVFFDMNRL